MRRGGGHLLAAAVLVLLTTQPAAAITYGSPTGPNRFQNVGSMVVALPGGLQQWCTGTLIRDADASGDGVFLTAAHCIAPLAPLGITLADVFITTR